MNKKYKITLVLLAITIFLSTISCFKSRCVRGIMGVKSKITFDFLISSNPVVWGDKSSDMFALGFLKKVKDKETGVRIGLGAYCATGSTIDVPDHMDKSPYYLHPKNQMASVDVNGDGVDELFLINLYGDFHAYSLSGSEVSGFPRKDVLKARDLVVTRFPFMGRDLDGDGSKDLLFLSHETYKDRYDLTFHGVGAISFNDKKINGFPVKFQKRPYFNSYILDNNRLFVQTMGGQLCAIDLDKREILPGFPLVLRTSDGPGKYGGYKMCLLKTWKKLAYAIDDKVIHFIDTKTGKRDKFIELGAEKITRVSSAQVKGLTGTKEFLYALDEKVNKILKINKKGQVVAGFKTNSGKDYSIAGYEAINVPGTKDIFHFLLSIRNSEEDINEMAEKYLTKEELKAIDELAVKEWSTEFDMDNLKPEQIERINLFKTGIKEEEMISKLGAKKYTHNRYHPPVTRILILKETSKGIHTWLDEEIKNHNNRAHAEGLSTLEPAVHHTPKAVYIVIPLNRCRELDSDTGWSYKSMLRIIELKK